MPGEKGDPPKLVGCLAVLAASSRPTGWPREALTALPQGALDPEKVTLVWHSLLVRQAFAFITQSQFSPLCRRCAPNRDRTNKPTNHPPNQPSILSSSSPCEGPGFQKEARRPSHKDVWIVL